MRTWHLYDWGYRLWTIGDVIGRRWPNQTVVEYFYRRAYWPGIKDAILPVILDEHGGVFVDADAERISDWSDPYFMNASGFAAYTEPHPGQPGRLGVSIVGSMPDSPVMAAWIDDQNMLQSYEPEWDTLVTGLTRAARVDPTFLRLPQGTFYPVGLNGGVDNSVHHFATHHWATTKHLY